MPPVDAAEIENRFSYHAPKGNQAARYEKLRAACGVLASLIVELTPESREQAMALSFLDEVSFFANAAIARRDQTQ